MEFFRFTRIIPFMRYAPWFNLVSAALFVGAVAIILVRGFNLSIEFTGGTVIEVAFPQPAQLEQVRGAVDTLGYPEFQVQNFGTSRDVLIRIPVQEGISASDQAEGVMQALRSLDAGVELRRVEFVGPVVGQELAEDGMLAMLFVIIGIMLYLAMRFEWKFAIGGIVANLHDVVIVMGVFALFGWEFSLPVLAALLAVLGYSVNESVVIFDRIRENFRKQRRASVPEIIDGAITATISRTAITHGSTLAMVFAMQIFGGPSLHYFALALSIGILFGIYSSIFVASGIILKLGIKREDLIKPVKKDPTDVIETP